MPEGPSIIIAREELLRFRGQKVKEASGRAPIDLDRLPGQRLEELRTWGKHLLFCFTGFTIRVHFLMFGTYFINERKKIEPRLSLRFNNGSELNIYTSAVVLIDQPLDEVYDWEADILSDSWNAALARKKLKESPSTLVTDALMDQEIFSGVGNIIKNETLFRTRIHPKNTIGDLPPRKLTELIREARNYGFDFLRWKGEGTLEDHWKAYEQKTCVRDGHPMHKETLGATKRGTYFCNHCQKKWKEGKAARPAKAK